MFVCTQTQTNIQLCSDFVFMKHHKGFEMKESRFDQNYFEMFHKNMSFTT